MIDKFVQDGDTVKFSLTSKFDEENLVGFNDDEVTIKIGKDNVIKGLEKGLIGMQEGEEKIIDITPEEGFGRINPELIERYPVKVFDDNDIKPKIGMTLQSEKGKFYITEVTDKDVEVNFNHPLAGKHLTLNVRVDNIIKDQTQ